MENQIDKVNLEDLLYIQKFLMTVTSNITTLIVTF